MGNTTNPYGMVRCQAESAAIISRFSMDGERTERFAVIVQPGQLASLCHAPQRRATGFLDEEIGAEEQGLVRWHPVMLEMELIGGPHDGEYSETNAAWGVWTRCDKQNQSEQP